IVQVHSRRCPQWYCHLTHRHRDRCKSLTDGCVNDIPAILEVCDEIVFNDCLCFHKLIGVSGCATCSAKSTIANTIGHIQPCKSQLSECFWIDTANKILSEGTIHLLCSLDII